MTCKAAARLPPRHRTQSGRRALPRRSVAAAPQDRAGAGASSSTDERCRSRPRGGARDGEAGRTAARLPPRHRTQGGRRALPGHRTAPCWRTPLDRRANSCRPRWRGRSVAGWRGGGVGGRGGAGVSAVVGVAEVVVWVEGNTKKVTDW